LTGITRIIAASDMPCGKVDVKLMALRYLTMRSLCAWVDYGSEKQLEASKLWICGREADQNHAWWTGKRETGKYPFRCLSHFPASRATL